MASSPKQRSKRQGDPAAQLWARGGSVRARSPTFEKNLLDVAFLSTSGDSTMTRQRPTLVIASCTVLALSAATGAFAHPSLVSAAPAVGGTVRTAPNAVTLRFNERLESAFSSVIIRDS